MDFLNYIQLAIKSLPAKGRRNGIKILSLGLGLAVSLVLLTKVCFEQTYDSFYEDADRIFYLSEQFYSNGEEMSHYNTSGGVAPRMKEFFPQVEAATRFTFYTHDTQLSLKDEERKASVRRVILADSCFFNLLDRQCLAGNLQEVLGMKGYAVISASLALRLSDKRNMMEAAADAIGKVFVIEDSNGQELTVAGVYEDFPMNASCQADVIISLSSIAMMGLYDGSDGLMGNDRYTSLVKLAKASDAEEINGNIQSFIKQYVPAETLKQIPEGIGLTLDPYKNYHNETNSKQDMMLVLAFVALALLLTSVLNYLLVVISTTVYRSREMALRKCLGCETKDLFSMMTAESMVHTLLACILACVLIFACKGTVEELAGTPVETLFSGLPLALALSVIAVVFLINALIPAAMYNRISVATVFRNFVAGKRVWKRVLLTVEFAAVAFLGVLLCIISLQYEKLSHADLGFDCEHTAIVSLSGLDDSQKKTLINEIRSLSVVEDATLCYQHPFEGYSGNNVRIPEGDYFWGEKDLFNISDGYWNDGRWIDVMGIKLVKGHQFTQEKYYDDEVLIDTSFEEKLKAMTGWEDVIGKEIQISEHTDGKLTSVITGVFEPISQGLYVNELAARPMAVFYLNADLTCKVFNFIIIRYHQLSSEAIAQTKVVLDKVAPDKNMEVSPFMYERLNEYRDTLNMRNMLLIGGIVTLLIALIGLIGYTIDEVKRRSKEIAIRRISGAMFSEIRGMFIKDILLITIPSALVGCMLAAVTAERWEQQFVEQVGLPMWVFLLVFTLTVALVSVVSDIYVQIVAGSNPAESIKTE